VARVLAAQEALLRKNEAWAIRHLPDFVPAAERQHAAELAAVVAGQQELGHRQQPPSACGAQPGPSAPLSVHQVGFSWLRRASFGFHVRSLYSRRP
jgi:hypothetical protein